MKYEVLRELRKVTQWKDGCVYRTAHIDIVWVPMDTISGAMFEKDGETYMYCSMSTSYKGETIRRIKLENK